jgi:hypothetical protein
VEAGGQAIYRKPTVGKRRNGRKEGYADPPVAIGEASTERYFMGYFIDIIVLMWPALVEKIWYNSGVKFYLDGAAVFSALRKAALSSPSHCSLLVL